MAKKQIAILGGGMGALSSAFELTNYEGWKDKYDVTVYQLGWRLGGKCATGRNQGMKNRIEEHGIHFLLGFYENAFHVVRQMYDEYLANFPSPFHSWKDAFRNQYTTTAMYQEDGKWSPFGITWPKKPGTPGDDALLANALAEFTPWSYIPETLGWMRTQLVMVQSQLEQLTRTVAAPSVTGLRNAVATPPGPGVAAAAVVNKISDIVARQMRQALDTAYTTATQYLTPPAANSPALQIILGQLLTFTVSLHNVIGFSDVDTRTRASGMKQYLMLLDVAAAVVGGMIKDGVIFEGFEKIDNVELRTWLTRHGCRYPNSTVVRSGYDACFAYLGGDPARPSISAGVGLQGGLRLWFTYKGSILWPMLAGMAEVIFTPMYHILCRRGVKFNFFHRVAKLGLSADRTNIDSIDLEIQAELKDPAAGYQPFVKVKDLECWPSQPLYDQLKDGEALRNYDLESAWNAPAPVGRKTLVRGAGFDTVVLGISIGALPTICRDLITASPSWRNMIANVSTVQTQAMQIWLKATADQLGYRAGTALPAPDAACVSSFEEPFDTYVDMTSLKVREEWMPSDQTTHLAYFCNVMKDSQHTPAPGTNPGFPAEQHAMVKTNCLTFLTDQMLPIWPRCNIGTGSFNWNFLVAPDNVNGADRFNYQYWRANIDPSSRYVLSPPGAVKYRLHPDGSGFANLYLAGDWTYNVLNSGCVEAATMSGRKAAQAICGYPIKIFGWK